MDEFIFNRSFLCVKLLILTEFATKLTFDDFKFSANYGRETDFMSQHIDKFDGTNFHLWKFKMQMVLEDKDLWGIVSGEEVEPAGEGTTEASVQKFRKRARKALATICLSISDSQLSLVRSANTAGEAWSKLERKRSEVSSDLGIAMEKALVTTKEMSRVAGHQVKSINKKGKCYNCGLKGHWARDCKKPKKSSERPRQQANVTEMEATHTLLWATASTDKKEANTWIIDSGASQHMSWCKERMGNFREFAVPEKVRLGDNRVVLAQGTGSVWVKVEVEGKWKPVELAEVLFVPDLAKNLLSISAIVKRNLSVVFNEDKCLILNSDGETLGLGRKDRKLFILDCLPMNELAHEANSAADSLQLWHQRFGHLGVKNFEYVAR